MYSVDDKKIRHKLCPKCGETKPETLWNFRDKAHTVFSSYCKTCDNVRKTLAARERFKDRDKRVKENHRQRLWKYGITQEQFDELIKHSGNKCQICGDTENLVIDHCHDTNKVRGLLCWSCNVALGHFKDSYDKLKNALEYLCRFNEKNRNS